MDSIKITTVYSAKDTNEKQARLEYLESIYLIENLYKKYIKNSQNWINNPITYKQKIWRGISPKKFKCQINTWKMLNIISNSEMQIKTTVRYHYTPEKTTKIYKAAQTVLARMSRTWNLQTLLMGM